MKTKFIRSRVISNLGKLDFSYKFSCSEDLENCRCPLNSNVSPIASFKKEWKYHLLINQALFYCSRFAWFYCWFNLSFDCLHLLEHGGVHWLEALLLSTLHTDTQHETWTIPLLIHILCYSYVLNLSMYLQWKLCLSVLYGVLWTLIIN